MAINPADLGIDLQPGDKISMTFHKAKAEPGSSFVQNAQSAGVIPGGPAGTSSLAPTPGIASGPMAPPTLADHGMLVQRMRQRLGLA